MVHRAGGIAVLVMSVWLLFVRGTHGANRFGDEQQPACGSARFRSTLLC